MCPRRGLLLVGLLSSLVHLSLARNLPTATREPGVSQRLHWSQRLLQEARQTLQPYSCTEETDHEDITKDKTSTVETCVPLELISIESCLPSRNTSFVKVQCLRNIYEDLRMYQMELQAVNEKLLMDPTRQIFLDKNLLEAIEKLMQALNFTSDRPELEQKTSLEDMNFYKIKTKLCILLHGFRIRAVTIYRMISYLYS
ncbi:PREDICTED: interleukin-12 subunit alpha isoform X2 [Condylura cristata]|uniref:interleukin-12 subunit alpha isoform X2 n=1 Tax=Condylura cristata TaxID=143302 RepID=UPI0006439D4B|nr:PREDICTED: interleukin-12 subunit alpha isoform X2 [Condylura cristata]